LSLNLSLKTPVRRKIHRSARFRTKRAQSVFRAQAAIMADQGSRNLLAWPMVLPTAMGIAVIITVKVAAETTLSRVLFMVWLSVGLEK